MIARHRGLEEREGKGKGGKGRGEFLKVGKNNEQIFPMEDLAFDLRIC